MRKKTRAARRPKRRTKARKRKTTTTARKRRTTATRKKRRTKTKARSNPARKRRTTRKKKTVRRRKTKAVRRKRRKTTARRRPAKRRKSTARKNPVSRRKKRTKARRRTGVRKARKNPRRRKASAVGSVRKQLMALLKPQSWLVPSLHGAVGFGIASYGPTVISRYTGQFGLYNSGMGGVALSGISTAIGAGLLTWIAAMLPKSGVAGKVTKGIGRNVAIGGMIATTIRLIHEVAPASKAAQYLPQVGGAGALSGMGYVSDAGYGSYPGQYPSYGPLGMVESPEQLVASESYARQIAPVGMGQPVPVEDIADWMQLSGGPAGMADWMSFTPGSPMAAQAAAGDPGFPGAQGF